MQYRKLLLRLDGSGTEEDPWRLPVPTGGLVSFDPESRIGVVAVLADDLLLHQGTEPVEDEDGNTFERPLKAPISLEEADSYTGEDGQVHQVHRIADPSDETHAQWHAHLDDRYREHAGRFRPRAG